MARGRRPRPAGRAGASAPPRVASLSHCLRRLEDVDGQLALPFILATYFPRRWAAIRTSVRLPPRGDDWRRLVDAAMEELPALFPIYELLDFPHEETDQDGYQLYHEVIPVLGPELYCPYRDGHTSPAELLLYGLCRPVAGDGCCTSCMCFTPGDALACVPDTALTQASRARLVRLVRLAEEAPSERACAALVDDAAGVFAAQTGPWHDVPRLARLISRQTGLAYLDVDPESWDEETQQVAWTFREVRFFAREYAAARAYRERLRPLHTALAGSDGLARLVELLALALAPLYAGDLSGSRTA